MRLDINQDDSPMVQICFGCFCIDNFDNRKRSREAEKEIEGRDEKASV